MNTWLEQTTQRVEQGRRLLLSFPSCKSICGIMLSICLLLLQVACSTPVTNTPAITVVSPSHAAIRLLTVGNGTVYLDGSDGVVTARRMMDGQLLWNQRIALSSPFQYLATSGTTLYDTFDEGTSAVVEARQSSDGHLLWRQQIPRLGPQPLLAHGDILYVDTSLNQSYGILYALRASDGHVLWHYTSGQVTTPDSFVYATEKLVAIFANTGVVRVLRTQDGSQVLVYQAASSWWPVIVDGRIYLHAQNQPLQAFRATDGVLLWTSSVSAVSFDTWTMDQGRIYINTGEVLEVLSEQAGSLLWQMSAGNGIIAGPVVQNQLVSVVTQDGVVVTWHASNGAAAWERQIGQFRFGLSYTDLYPAGTFLFGPDKQTISAWRSSDGKDLWSYTASAPIRWEPESANGVLLLWKFDGTLDVLDLHTGNVLWRYLL